MWSWRFAAVIEFNSTLRGMVISYPDCCMNTLTRLLSRKAYEPAFWFRLKVITLGQRVMKNNIAAGAYNLGAPRYVGSYSIFQLCGY